jgi:hypothetical protein
MTQRASIAIDFSADVTDHARGLTDREWVFEKIDSWLGSSHAPRFFLVRGQPGSGKTAVASRLAQISRAIYCYTPKMSYDRKRFR